MLCATRQSLRGFHSKRAQSSRTPGSPAALGFGDEAEIEALSSRNIVMYQIMKTQTFYKGEQYLAI